MQLRAATPKGSCLKLPFLHACLIFPGGQAGALREPLLEGSCASPCRLLNAASRLSAAVEDCSTGATKKACANCTCGRAEEEAAGIKAELTPDMLDNPQSACGSVRPSPCPCLHIHVRMDLSIICLVHISQMLTEFSEPRCASRTDHMQTQSLLLCAAADIEAQSVMRFGCGEAGARLL